MIDQDFEQVTRAQLEESDAIIGFFEVNRFLSNFASSDITMYGIRFPTVEHAFAAAKIDPNRDPHNRAAALDEMQRIADAPTPGQAKKLGRRRTLPDGQPLMRRDWDEIKVSLVTELVRRKFQDPVLKQKLLATADKRLVEANTWGDRIWGMVETKEGVFEGRNLLGKILMLIRSEIARSQ